MDTLTVYAGLDYADSCVQVCLLNREGLQLGNRRCDNDLVDIVDFAARFGGRVRAAIEACGGAADLADELVQRAGWSVDLAHPGYVHRIKQNPDKSDYTDARLLADLERVGYLPRVWLAPQSVRELRRMVRYRQQWVEQRRALKLRVSALLREHRVVRPEGSSWTKQWLHWIARIELPQESAWIISRHLRWVDQCNEEIELAESRLEAATHDDPLVTRLQTYVGIGLVTACVLRAEIGDFGRFRTGKQLARFCGLTPCNASSGNRQADAGLIRAGNPLLRATLIEAAHRLMRFDPRWREFTARQLMAGKPKSVICAAVANRWMRWLYHQVKEIGAPVAA